MKTTLELPDDLFRRTKATAALRGESIKDFVAAALTAYLAGQERGPAGGWRAVFGKAAPEAVAELDQILAEEFERIDPEGWR